ncbi:MAG: transporter, partial [Symploca sp. SIO3E6]|nr:transporter [Caldora sp. SIO3E6]
TKAELAEYVVTPESSVPWQDVPVTATTKVAGELTTGFSAEALEPINAIAIDQTPVPELNNPELVAQPSEATSTIDTNTEELDWQDASSTTLPIQQDELDWQDASSTTLPIQQNEPDWQDASSTTLSIQQDELDWQDASSTGVFFLSDSDDGSLSPNGELQWTSARPDGHAPISVMGEHTHQAGEFMFSYRYMYMRMDGNRDGTDDLSDQEVLQQFPVTPTNMDMEMHMFGGMYAPTDDLTLMVMIPYVLKEMDHVTRTGVNFTTNSEGFGDLQLTGLYNVLRQNRQRVHFNLGVSFPTGSIDERDDIPAGNVVLSKELA